MTSAQFPTGRPLVTHPRIPACGPSPAMPSALEQALLEFGLLRAFRVRTPREQGEYVQWIAAAGHDTVRRDRIAGLLDDLAAGSHAYSPTAAASR